MLNKAKKKKLRDFLVKKLPNEKEALLAQGLEEEIKSVAAQLENVKGSSGSIKEIQNNLDNLKIIILNKLENLPTTSDLEGVKKKYLEQISSLKNELTLLVSNIETDVLGLNSEVSGNKEETEKAIEKWRKDFLFKLENIGGGSMNQQIAVNGIVATSRYADINIVASGATIANDNTKKRTNITLLSGGTPAGVDGDLQINSSGAFGTISGLNLNKTGNARGTKSLDIQTERLVVTNVASGACATTIGQDNTASGNYI